MVAQRPPIGEQNPDIAADGCRLPELSAGLHLPKFARIEAHMESTACGDIFDPFRPHYAVDMQLLDDDGQNAAAPVYQAVPLPRGLGRQSAT